MIAQDAMVEAIRNLRERVEGIHKRLNDITPAILSISAIENLHHENRIRSLENWRSWALGVGTGIGIVCGIAGATVGFLVASSVSVYVQGGN